MSTYRKRKKYYTSADYYSSTAYQEYGDNDYIESGTDYAGEYQYYPEETKEYVEDDQGYQNYSKEAGDYYEGYTEYQQPEYDYGQQYQQPEYDYGQQYQQPGYHYSQSYQQPGHDYSWKYQGYQQSGYTGYDRQDQKERQSGTRYQQPYERYRQHRFDGGRNNKESDRQYSQPYQRLGDGQEQKVQKPAKPEEEGDVQDSGGLKPDERDVLRRRQVHRHRSMREERRRRRRRRLFIALAVRAGCMLFALTTVILLIRLVFFSNPVRRKVTVEAGTELNVKDFIKKDKVEGEFVTDVSKVRLDHVGEQEIILKVKGKERKSRLVVKDTKAPQGEASSVTIDVDGELKAKELVEKIKDATDVKCSFKRKPDLSKTGNTSAVVLLTDEGGNTAEVEADIQVIVDTEAPVIDGVAPLTGFIGEPISYKSTITVTDNCVRDMEVEVDNSKVDTKTEGTYDVFYTAVDRAGNKTEAATTITIKEKPANYVTPEEVLAEADEVLEEITDKDMTLKEKARAIYEWTRTEIGYVNTSDKDSWTNGAHQGFTEKSGDCFVFFSTSKALLTQAGIPNLDVVKSDTSHSSHYWSLIDCGDGWYHFDTTPRQGGGDDFFMKTDDEILKYSANHRDSHIFDQSLYPATPKEDSTIK